MQTIEAMSHMGAHHFTAGLVVGDLNFDGYADLGLYTDGGAKWSSHAYWLFDPAAGRFVENDLSRDLGRLAANQVAAQPSTSTIEASYLAGGGDCTLGVYDIFQIVHGRLVQVETHQREIGREPKGYCLVKVSRLRDGRMQTVRVERRALDDLGSTAH